MRHAIEEVLRRPVVAVLAVGVVLSGGAVAAASGWMPIFQTDRIAALKLSGADLLALPDLEEYGDIAVTREPDVRTVPDAATAAARTGLDVPEVATLPRGVSGKPIYQVGRKASATFTFSADQAADAAAGAGAGQTAPPPPPGLDGSRVRLVAGPGVAQIWQSAAGAPALVVARAGAPKAFSSGVPFEVMRDHLLALPGVPEDVAAQLRAFGADGATLPLPVPAGEVITAQAQVNGAPATVLTSRDRSIAAVVWARDGVVTAVAGSLDDDEVLSIARDLR